MPLLILTFNKEKSKCYITSLSEATLLGLSAIFLSLILSNHTNAQTATYHLHKDASSTSGLNQLKTAGPDAATVAVTSVNLKNLATGEYIIKAFDTLSGVPNAAGVIPSGSTVTFTLWLKKTANVGTMFPRAKLNLNSSAGASLCSTTGATALTTTLTSYTLSCTTASNVSMTATDRLYLWVGVNLTATGGSNFMGSLNVEGTLNGNYNSRIVAPLPITPPSISSLSATSGPVGTSITVNGANFGATQGSSTVTFNGTAATPTSWGNSSIVAPVPVAATTGPVVVTVQGVVSNSMTFTVAPKIDSLSFTSGSVGTTVTISGTTFGATQGSSTVTFNGTAATPTSWNSTSIAVPVPPGATTGPVVVTVSGQASNGVSFTVTPKIDNLSPSSGSAGNAITISGTTFGATQGTSTITFNGSAATPTSWGHSSIVAPVPSGATTGPVVVTVNGQASNGVTFTVAARIDNLSPTSGGIGAPVTITGSAFGASQGTSTVTFNGITAAPTLWNATSIEASVPAGATTGPVVVTVAGAPSNGVTFTVPTTGTISGRITAGDGTTPIPGATVKALQGTNTIATTSTNGTGDYSLTPLDAGIYTLTASATGYGNKTRSAVSVTGGATTTVNLSLDAIVSGPVSYIYDPLGRLKATVGPIDTVVYNYDAVGNLLSIARQSSGQVSILSFYPGSGPVGATVTINGTGFSDTPSQNSVQFNGTAATITSATANTIVAVVPPGATTGPISIISPNGSASSSSSFTVGQGSAPVITGFSPTIGALNDVVTISGSNFEPTPADNKVRFNIAMAQITSSNPTTIVTRASTTLSSKVSVTTPYGTTVAAGDFFVPPPPRTAAEVEYAARMTIDSSLTPFINTPNKIAMVLFDGNGGQRISIKLGPSTFSYGYVDFYRPDGLPLMESVVLASWVPSKFIEPFVLPATGTYTIVVRGNGSTTGGTPITLYNMPPDVSGTVEIGGPAQAVTNTTPGQNANLTFSGTQGQEVSLLTSGSTIQGSVTIKKPDGSSFGFAYFNPPGWGAEAFVDKQVLPVTGTYTVFVDPIQAATGTTNVRLYDATDSTGSIVPGASPVTVTATTPGQNARLTFDGNTGQRISLKLNSFGINYDVYIKRPNGTNAAQINIASGWTGGFINPITLDTTGTYSILIDPYSSNTGNVTLTLYDVPADLTGTLTIGSAAIPVTISTPGQNANLTFEGTANQQVTVRVTGSTYSGCVLVTLLSPSGSSLVEGGPCSTNFNLATWTLPTTGTYTVKVDPIAAATGSLNLNVTSP